MTGGLRRARGPGPGAGPLRRAVAALALGGLGAAVVAPPAGAAPAGSPVTAPVSSPLPAGAIGATQAQVDAIEAQLASQQDTLASLSERYDQAGVHLSEVQSELAATGARLADATRRHDRAYRRLQQAAVRAYMYDTPADALGALFETAPETAELRNTYEVTAIGDIGAAVSALQSSELQLRSTEGVQRTQHAQAVTAAAQVGQAQQAAQALATSTAVTLSAVKGHLAQLVAARAAQQARAAAVAAAAAATQAAQQQAAQQAAQAAQVAQTLGAGTAAATDATTAANQASQSAGHPGAVGNGQPQSAAGAGALALARAEQFLGVPYEWGGASAQGLDCSGLTMLAWQAAGVGLVHSAALQFLQSTPVPLTAVKPGDLLFYDLDGSGIDHVVMYVGSGAYGAATIIQAAHAGTVVEFDPVWYTGLVGAGRP